MRNPFDTDPETSQFRRALRNTFQQLPHDVITAMTGGNAIRCYDLDAKLLKRTAETIGAPSVGVLATPPVGELVGTNGTGGLTFRHEAWT